MLRLSHAYIFTIHVDCTCESNCDKLTCIFPIFILTLYNIWHVILSVFPPRYQGYVSAALVLGGVDTTGAYLYTVYPRGSTDKLPYVTMGEL